MFSFVFIENLFAKHSLFLPFFSLSLSSVQVGGGKSTAWLAGHNFFRNLGTIKKINKIFCSSNAEKRFLFT